MAAILQKRLNTFRIHRIPLLPVPDLRLLPLMLRLPICRVLHGRGCPCRLCAHLLGTSLMTQVGSNTPDQADERPYDGIAPTVLR